MTRDIKIEMADNANRIEVRFRYDERDVRTVKNEVVGARWLKKKKAWAVPLTMKTCKELREAFGQRLHVGPNLARWARQWVALEKKMWELSHEKDAELERLPDHMPELVDWLRPYQRVGVKFIAESPGALVADEMGLGKTAQVFCGVIESGMIEGDHLIITPKTALDVGVWSSEHAKLNMPGEVFEVTGTAKQREAVIEKFLVSEAATRWLVVNPAQVRDGKIPDNEWEVVVVDECHKDGTRNPRTLTAEAIYALKARKRIAMSGTPITNRTKDLWGTLHFLDPELFSNLWNWAYQWLVVTDNGYGKDIGGIQPEAEDEFFKSLSPYMLRRTKVEVAPELPPKQTVDVWCNMKPKQRQVYVKFAKDALVRLNDVEVAGTGVLAELTRLKQFAGALQEVLGEDEDGKPMLRPIFKESGKADRVEDKLVELGIIEYQGNKIVPGPVTDDSEKVVICSQFTSMIESVNDWLQGMGIHAGMVHGGITGKNRKREVDMFQHGDTPVMLLNTLAGGTAITLDRASNVFFLDETWSPTDQQQAADRCHRLSRIHQVMVYYFRSRRTVEEEIMEKVGEKGDVHQFILDKRRELQLFW